MIARVPRFSGTIERLLGAADIRLNGPDPWDFQVRNERVFARILAHGSLGLGESYLDGDWECAQLDELFHRILRSGVQKRAPRNLRLLAGQLPARWLNLQTTRRAFIPAQVHYDLGNDLFEATFDTRLTGSCGYWRVATELDAAQEAKHDLICRKLGLQRGQTVFDIGCGWGAFMKFSAERYGVQCTGVTVSREQIAWGEQRCRGLPVRFILGDYRQLPADAAGPYDQLVSMGMFEHVGNKNYRAYFDVAQRLLKPEGLFLLHTIGSTYSDFEIDPWLDKYIFPNAVLPSIAQIGRAIEGRFMMEDWHNFGADYDNTLMAWFHKFDGNWPRIAAHYGERFYRIWKYYLLSCAGGFRARVIQLWQLVLSKHGVPGGYLSVR
ncbi:MAG TPA: cyclopropane fatty acyl phospholipid synthase [Steroidobacteraceae bacterium]|nr:cyclopropane fatty acyl phospholipid synthase [Steroidobacteraceae bacterium]